MNESDSKSTLEFIKSIKLLSEMAQDIQSSEDPNVKKLTNDILSKKKMLRDLIETIKDSEFYIDPESGKILDSALDDLEGIGKVPIKNKLNVPSSPLKISNEKNEQDDIANAVSDIDSDEDDEENNDSKPDSDNIVKEEYNEEDSEEDSNKEESDSEDDQKVKLDEIKVDTDAVKMEISSSENNSESDLPDLESEEYEDEEENEESEDEPKEKKSSKTKSEKSIEKKAKDITFNIKEIEKKFKSLKNEKSGSELAKEAGYSQYRAGCSCESCSKYHSKKTNKVDYIYSLMTKIDFKRGYLNHQEKDFIDNYKDYIFSTEQTFDNGQTILHKCVGNRNDILMYMLKSHYCSYEYMCMVDAYGKNFLLYSIANDISLFNSILSSYDTQSDNVKTIIAKDPQKTIFTLITNGYKESLVQYIERIASIEKHYEGLTSIWDYGPEALSYYNPITYILDHQDDYMNDDVSFKSLFTELESKEWFNHKFIKYTVKILFKKENFASIIIMNTMLGEVNKINLASIILNDATLFNNKCLNNIAIEILIENKKVADDAGINRLQMIMKGNDVSRLVRLLESRNFTEEEFARKDTHGMNCFLYAIKNNPKLLETLLSCRHFNVKMLHEHDYEDHGLLYYIRTYASDSEHARGLYEMIFQEPEDMSHVLTSDIMCPICMEKRVNLVLIPCGHTHCSKCIKPDYTECYVCKEKIVTYNHLRI